MSRLTPIQMKAVTFYGNMSSITLTTSYQNGASVALPTVTAAHKYLIIASFEFNATGGSTNGDINGAIRNGTTVLQTVYWSPLNGSYFNNVPVNMVFTSSATGGETINFSVLKNSAGTITLGTRSMYSIVDLGEA